METKEGLVAATVEKMLASMEKWKASDLFVCEGKTPAVRLHGSVVPLDVAPTSREVMEEFLAKTVSPSALCTFREKGDMDLGWTLGARRFRINLARQMGALSLVARALPGGELTFEELGLPWQVAALADLQRGLVLVTGATGSGKSTTLAAVVHRINTTRKVHIVTVEEPIEFVHADLTGRVTQREVGTDTESFDVALREALRESPDVILIGEMRDIATMRVALQAALTGHLVLATLHTIDTSQTLQRILSYFPEEHRSQVATDLSLSLRGIVSQRLMPRKDGKGRVVAVEMLTVTPAAARLIAEKRVDDLVDLMKASTDPGIVPFNRALLGLYRKGLITHEMGKAHASNPEEFDLSCRGMETGVSVFRTDEGGAASGLDMQSLLGHVLERGASDLHLFVGSPPILRIDGILVPIDVPPLGAGDLRLLIYSLLGQRQRSIHELERELDFSLTIDGGNRFRVNVYWERGNMAAALRSIPSVIPAAEDLGLPQGLLDMGRTPQGLLLVVGPTGSGKTTTLACLVDRINRLTSCHIVTIEDPIEYVHRNVKSIIHQREVHSDTLGFATALKYILRQDPDVVLIGELRDQETISAALTTAETGHLVLATLHTNDAVQTVDRIVDVFPPHQQPQARVQLAASLVGVVSQRLLPRADGRGRVAAFEVMVATPAIRTMIRDNKMHQAMSVLQSSAQSGMLTLDMSLGRLVEKGLIDRDEALRLAHNPKLVPERTDDPSQTPPSDRPEG